QAEDGIRDRTVTGVQTCALPIFQVAGRTIAFRGGLCAFDTAFKVSIGKLLIASTGVVPSYFVLAVTAYADGTYRNGQAGGAVREIGRASCRERAERAQRAGRLRG